MIFDRVEDKSRGKKREGREKNKTELGIYRNRGWFFSKIDKISQEVSFHEEESRIVGDRWKEMDKNLDQKLFYSISRET